MENTNAVAKLAATPAHQLRQIQEAIAKIKTGEYPHTKTSGPIRLPGLSVAVTINDLKDPKVLAKVVGDLLNAQATYAEGQEFLGNSRYEPLDFGGIEVDAILHDLRIQNDRLNAVTRLAQLEAAEKAVRKTLGIEDRKVLDELARNEALENVLHLL